MTDVNQASLRMYQLKLEQLESTIEQLQSDKRRLEKDLETARVDGFKPKRIMRLCMPKSQWK